MSLLLCLIVLCGCTSEGTNPAVPDTGNDPQMILTHGADVQMQSQTYLWGYFDIYIDPETKSVEVTPNRTIEFTANIVHFLNANPLGLSVSFNDTTVEADYVEIDMDVTISHPLDNEKFVGYDVRGIFIGEGAASLDYNGNLRYAERGTDQILMNADGYTRWYNIPEFNSSGLFAYTPGLLATTGYSPEATLNPYKYFGEGLGATDDLYLYLTSGDPQAGYFLNATSNTRNYVIRFPVPMPGVRYAYAVTADWSGGAPEFHPSHAVDPIVCDVVDESTLYYVDETTNGGDLILDISVFDWYAETITTAMEDYLITIESTVLSTPYTLSPTEMTPVSGANQSYTYHVEIPATNITGLEGNELWVIVEKAGYDYTNPFGVPNLAGSETLTGCFRHDLYVFNIEPFWITVTGPNGGESWLVGDTGEITWDAHPLLENVTIGLSLNSGVDYTVPVVSGTLNDGSFIWDPIPPEAISEQCRIKVWDPDNDTVNDESDADFTILGDHITVTYPNGGEQFKPLTVEEVTWDSYGITGNVDIEYSSDNFVSDINAIVMDTADDGACNWSTVPCDLSNSLRVRISSIDFPTVTDTSDADFSIVEGGWATSYEQTSNQLNCQGVTVDAEGSSYVLTNLHSVDTMLLLKYSPCGQLIWSWEWDFAYVIEGMSIETDDLGNVFIAGNCHTDHLSYDFDPSGGEDLHTTGSEDGGFLMKYSPSGEYQWTVVWRSGNFMRTFDMELTSTEVYIAGWYDSGYDFDPDPIDVYNENPYGTRDGYLLKLDQTGDFQWVRHLGSAGELILGRGLGVDPMTGQVYMTGYFTGINIDFDPGTEPGEEDFHDSMGAEDIYLTAFDASGAYLWTRTWGGSGTGETGYAISVDESGNCYVVGDFTQTVDFNPDDDPGAVDERDSVGEFDAFLSAFDSSGNYLWVNTWGGPGDEFPNNLDIDFSGNIYVVGNFSNTVDFDAGPGVYELTSNGLYDAFLTKVDNNGMHLWSRGWGGGDGSYDIACDVEVSLKGFVYVTGEFHEPDTEFAPVGEPCFQESFLLSDIDSSGDPFIMKSLPDGCW